MKPAVVVARFRWGGEHYLVLYVEDEQTMGWSVMTDDAAARLPQGLDWSRLDDGYSWY